MKAKFHSKKTSMAKNVIDIIKKEEDVDDVEIEVPEE